MSIMWMSCSNKEDELSITANPESGSYTGSINVTLTPSIGGSTIYYTTDGTTPTRESNVYSEPVRITHSMALKFFGIAPVKSKGSFTEGLSNTFGGEVETENVSEEYSEQYIIGYSSSGSSSSSSGTAATYNPKKRDYNCPSIPALKARKMENSLLKNGYLTDLENWEQQECSYEYQQQDWWNKQNYTEETTCEMEEGEGYVSWERSSNLWGNDQLSISQEINEDISDFETLVLSMDVWICIHNQTNPDWGTDKTGTMPIKVNLEYEDEYGNKENWIHGFMYDVHLESKLKNVTTVTKLKWNHIALDVLNNENRKDPLGTKVLTKPVKVTKLSILGAGQDFIAAIGNIRLRDNADDVAKEESDFVENSNSNNSSTTNSSTEISASLRLSIQALLDTGTSHQQIAAELDIDLSIVEQVADE